MSEVKNIPVGWVETEIGNLVDLAQGVAINAKTDYVLSDKENGIPLLKINNLLNNTIDQYANPNLVPKQSIIHKDDIIFTRTGQVGAVLFNKYGILHNNSFKVIPKEDIYWKYLYWYLKSKQVYNYVQKVASGSVQKDLNHGAFKTIEFKYPKNKEEQKSIAAILTALDDKIELLQSQNKTLEETAQTIFAEWFGKYQIEDELPEGYKFGELGDVAMNHSKTFKFTNENVVFVNTGDVLEGQFLHSNQISPIGLPGQAKKAIELYDILYSEIRPKNKRFAFVDFDTSNYVVSTKFMIIRPKSDFSPFILYLILKNQDTIDEFNIVAESRSGTFPQITFDAVKSFPIVIPSKQKQNDFDNILLPIMEKKKLNHQQIQTLTKTRDELLPRLMRGEVRVQL